MVAWFFSTAMDYLVSYSLLMIIGNSINLSKGIDLILSPGKTKVVYLISDKFIQLAIFMCLKKIYPGLKKIKELFQKVLDKFCRGMEDDKTVEILGV